jgi:hypothetical protein
VKIQKEEPIYYAFSATLRVFGDIENLDEISRMLGIQPTHSHRRGERRSARAEPYKHDMWSYKAPVPENHPLSEHLTALYAAVTPKAEYLKGLRKRGLSVDIFCGYRSNSDTAGFEVDHKALRIFAELEVPFGVSVIIT